MDPAFAAPLSVLAGAIATAVIAWASWRWPRGYHRKDAGVPDQADDDTA